MVQIYLDFEDVFTQSAWSSSKKESAQGTVRHATMAIRRSWSMIESYLSCHR
jgi:hypothetical protein